MVRFNMENCSIPHRLTLSIEVLPERLYLAIGGVVYAPGLTYL